MVPKMPNENFLKTTLYLWWDGKFSTIRYFEETAVSILQKQSWVLHDTIDHIHGQISFYQLDAYLFKRVIEDLLATNLKILPV